MNDFKVVLDVNKVTSKTLYLINIIKWKQSMKIVNKPHFHLHPRLVGKQKDLFARDQDIFPD